MILKFTEVVYMLMGLNSSYIGSMLNKVQSSGTHVNTDCWLRFPFFCLNCSFRTRKGFKVFGEYAENIRLFSETCQIINGTKDQSDLIVLDNKDYLLRIRNAVQYDPNIRPNFLRQPDVINVGFQIISIENLDLTDSSFQIDFFLHQEWMDHRLQHHYHEPINGNNLEIEVWRPDTYFVQSKRNKHFIGKEHQRVTLNVKNNGHIYYRSRLSMEVLCPMDLHQFPMDIQKCLLEMESYAYMWNELQYDWSVMNVSMYVLKGSLKSLSQYELKPVTATKGVSEYVLGNWSNLRMEFIFKRNSIIFIPGMYFPCAMIVFISWITFFLDVDHYPARTYLCVTSLLTIVMLEAAISSSLPRVSYVKAIDKYVMVCILFVFLAFVEYACVLYIRSMKNNHLINRKVYSHSIKRRKGPETMETNIDNDQSELLFENPQNPMIRKRNSIWQSHEKIGNLHIEDHITFTKVEKRFDLDDKWPKKLDIFSRIFFPVVFIIFNAFYWVTSGDKCC